MRFILCLFAVFLCACSLQCAELASAPSIGLEPVVTSNVTLFTRLADLFTATSSLPVRTILSLLLGLLLSLTPCIYPMIPITVGILQAGSSNSFVHNFLRSTAYTTGMATTFAILGLIAAYTGSLFGSVMNSPWVIGCIVIMLIYVAGSMIGFYDMYIPRFLQKSSSSPRGGSLLGAFAFGIASGTVASPCLSPGLLLLISIIAREGNMFAGFLMLFAFGIGLATPLWLIGTFSSTLALLPRAGTWMVEIKKLLGYVILLMCLYFLKPFVPHYLLWWFAAIIVGFILIRYIRDSKQKMRYTHLVGSCILGIIFAKCILETVQQHAPVEHIFWHHEFNEAQQLAIAQHKKILLDVTAPYCTICSAIEKKFFTDPNMQKLCAQHYIPVKIDASDETHPMHAPLRRSLHIVGVPTLIILEPATLTEVRRWGAELYDYDHDRFVQELL